MASEVVSGSIPGELLPVWRACSDMHGGPSKFLQWVLRTLGPLGDAAMDAQGRALQAASLEARLAFLQANVTAEQAEVSRLVAALAEVRPAAPRAGNYPPEVWWRDLIARRGLEGVLQLSDRQLHALAEQRGARAEECLAFAAARRQEASAALLERLRAARARN